MISLIAVLKRVTISGGVPAGASNPNHKSFSTSPSPCSASVGTSGMAAERCWLAMPSTRIWLSRANGSATWVGMNIALTWLPTRSVITPDGWKLITTLETKGRELYDLNRDPGEQKNLATTEPRRAGELQKKLLAHFKAIGHDLAAREWKVGLNPVYASQAKKK